jgi:DNA-binding response OmpR family regulator
VVVADDETGVADVQALTLQDSYDVRVAYGGREALNAIDETVDAVLLDRRMPDVHGDEVLERIRERGIDCVVIMATAVDPDLNVLEMDFDDYLTKPIDSETLTSALEQQLETRPNDADLSTFFSLVSKIEVLEDELPPDELAESEEYERARQRATELGRDLDDRYDDFEAIVDTFRDVDRGSS